MIDHSTAFISPRSPQVGSPRPWTLRRVLRLQRTEVEGAPVGRINVRDGMIARHDFPWFGMIYIRLHHYLPWVAMNYAYSSTIHHDFIPLFSMMYHDLYYSSPWFAMIHTIIHDDLHDLLCIIHGSWYLVDMVLWDCLAKPHRCHVCFSVHFQSFQSSLLPCHFVFPLCGTPDFVPWLTGTAPPLIIPINHLVFPLCSPPNMGVSWWICHWKSTTGVAASRDGQTLPQHGGDWGESSWAQEVTY